MGIRNAGFSNEGQGRALIELAMQYSPKNAIREYVTNGLDARLNGRPENITVALYPNQKKLIISDDGTGIPYDKLMSLPVKIGESGKYGRIDSRGEKALGLLAFGSLGKTMHMLSRHCQDFSPTINYLRWEINRAKGKIPVTNERLTDLQVDEYFGGPLSSGTRIVIAHIDTHIFEKDLTNANLKNWLRSLYNPAIINGTLNLTLGRQTPRSGYKTEVLKPIGYEEDGSTLLLDDTLQIKVKGQEELGDLEVLLFVNPEASSDKVAVYSKDVLVNDSIADRNHFPDFSKSPIWTSGKISGFFNDRFNKLVLGRDGIQRGSNAYKAWYNAIEQVEEQIRPIVEEHRRKGRKMSENRHIKQAFDAVSEIWKDLNQFGGDPTYQVDEGGAETNTTEHNNGNGKPRGRGGEGSNGGKPGDRNYVQDDNGSSRTVTPKNKVPFPCPQPVSFPLHEKAMRSKLEEKLGDRPILFINSDHRNYKTTSEAKDKTSFLRYHIELIASRAAQYEANISEREGRLNGSDPSDIAQLVLGREEEIRFLALERLGLI